MPPKEDNVWGKIIDIFTLSFLINSRTFTTPYLYFVYSITVFSMKN